MTRPNFKEMDDTAFRHMAGHRAAERLASYEELRAMVVDSCRRLRQRAPEGAKARPSESPESGEPYDEKVHGELYDARPGCDHRIVCASGGGIKCTKCPGWFCY